MGGLLRYQIEAFASFSQAECELLDAVVRKNVTVARPRRDIVREGDTPRSVDVILDGWACRYKQLRDGRRQIVAFLIPGDVTDADVHLLRKMDHSIGAITRVQYAQIAPVDIETLVNASPQIALALRRHELVNASVQREWTTNVGQRCAIERIAHLCCELFVRLRMVDLTEGQTCDFPLTQYDLADATGLTSVHVNRTLQDLRRQNAIKLIDKKLTIPELDSLMAMCAFNANYLHYDSQTGS